MEEHPWQSSGLPSRYNQTLLKRQSKARPIDALSEMIWNGLDADASRVDLRFSHNEFALSGITVADDGHGIPRAEASTLFTRLGGSWKER